MKKYLKNILWNNIKENCVRMLFRLTNDIVSAAKEYHMIRHHHFYYDEIKSKVHSMKCNDKAYGCKWTSTKEGKCKYMKDYIIAQTQ